MKRLVIAMFLLGAGAALGGGGLYVGLNWKQLNPWRSQDDPTVPLLAQLRRFCATDKALKGAYIKSAEIKEGKLTLRGLAANKEQIAAIDAKLRAYLDETPDLQTQCAAGYSTDGVKLFAMHEQLGQWQRDFAEGKGAEKDPLRREVMRLTRLDDAAFSDEGVFVIKGVCIRGTSKTEPATDALKSILKLDAAGIAPELLPEISVAVQHVANPAVALQKQLAADPAHQGIHVLSAWYDGNGNLHIEGLIAKDEQRKIVEAALAGLANDPQLAVAVKSPGADAPKLRLIAFDSASAPRDLQKQLVELARKENKPHLRSVRIASVKPTPIADDKKNPVADGAGNPKYAFRVLGSVLDSAGSGKKAEADLDAFLAAALPQVHNADQTPIVPQIDLAVRVNPIYALQERLVQRGLDGAAITAAAYDEDGKLEIVGRVNQPGDESKQALEAAVKDLLADDTPWALDVKPHEASKDGQPIAWSDVTRACQAKLAGDRAVGRRTRLDRLYFRYVGQKLQLAGEGVFLADVAGVNDDAAAALAKTVDDVIVSRSGVPVSAAFKKLANPLIELQDLTTQRADLDGVLFTAARYGPDGRFHLDGYLGQAEHKITLTPLLGEKLERIPELLKKTGDPKAALAWTIDGMRTHPSAKGEWKWSEIVGACRAEAETASPRICVERVWFQYADARPRRLTLQVKAIALTRPGEKIDEPMLTQKLDALGKRLLADAAIEQTAVALVKTESPIFALQKRAEADRLDGLLFQDASYDRDGKLVLSGIRGSDEQLKNIQTLLDKALADAPFAPHGVASLDRMRLVPWQPLLTSARAQFAGDTTQLLKQTRIDRVFFQHDDGGKKTIIHIQGVSVYQGKTLDAEAQTAALRERLSKHLQAQGVEGFTLDIAGIERKVNPTLELQRQAIDAGMDGVLFQSVGFDAKGSCYMKTFIPKGQEENVRKLIEDAAKKHPHLGGITAK